jgi:uncharacterized protein YndB with AHSA1/START domain
MSAAVVDVTSEREIVSTRVFQAPRELVWQAWAEPKNLEQWWGPRGFTTTTLEMELRVGGKWRIVMHGPDGTDYPNNGVFTEVVPGEQVKYVLSGGKPGEEVTMARTISFDEEDGGTRMTIRMEFPTAQERDFVVETYGAVKGAQETFERLAEFLAEEMETA